VLGVDEDRRLEEQALSAIIALLRTPTSRQMFYQRNGVMRALIPIDDADCSHRELATKGNMIHKFACVTCIVNTRVPPNWFILPRSYDVVSIWAKDWAEYKWCVQRKSTSAVATSKTKWSEVR